MEQNLYNINLVDFEKLYSEYGADIIYQILEKMFETIPDYYKQLKDSCTANNFEIIRQSAHSIKGMAMNLYLNELKKIAGELEYAASEENKEKIAKNIADFDNIYEKTLEILKNNYQN